MLLDGDPAPLPRKGAQLPQFSAHDYCGQTAGSIKMPLGMDVGIGPGYILLDGDSAPPQKKMDTAPQPPIFGPCLLWQNDRPSQLLLSSCYLLLLFVFIRKVRVTVAEVRASQIRAVI